MYQVLNIGRKGNDAGGGLTGKWIVRSHATKLTRVLFTAKKATTFLRIFHGGTSHRKLHRIHKNNRIYPNFVLDVDN